MRRGRALGCAAAAAGVMALALPGAAWAHAALLRTSPSASGTVNGSPAVVRLTYSEAVEPKFALVSVTDADGHRVTRGPASRSKSNPDQLVVPLDRLARGWYLVFWRVISVDGHPVRGAFTFAVGPNPGPAPQFAIPSLRETAATPGLLTLRWACFLTVMAGVGLLIFRLVIVRPLARRVPDASLRSVSTALAIALGLGLVVVPIYVDVATAQFSERSAFDLGNLVPLMRASSFGRSFLDLELVLALGAVATAVAVLLDKPAREQRSVAELLAITGALLAAGAALLVPGLGGHAGQYSPRGLSLSLDWLHLLAGSLWIGGLIGLTVLAATAGARRVASMVVVVPRFSRVAFCSVLLLIASGTAATFVRLPTLSSLWNTGYGQALLVKIGVLTVALGLAGVNLLRNKPRLEAVRGRPGLGTPTVTLLRRLVGGEVGLVVVAIFVAGVLSSLAPPPKALAGIGRAAATVGPGPVTRTVSHGPYRLTFRITPNRAAVPNAFLVKVTKGGRPVEGADVVADFDMLDMEMERQAYRLAPQGRGAYGKRSVPSLVMVGRWGLSFSVSIPSQRPFQVVLVDHAQG
jgi:copper transport protein